MALPFHCGARSSWKMEFEYKKKKKKHAWVCEGAGSVQGVRRWEVPGQTVPAGTASKCKALFVPCSPCGMPRAGGRAQRVEASQGFGTDTIRDACRRVDRKEAVKCLQLFLLSAKAKRLLPGLS